MKQSQIKLNTSKTKELIIHRPKATYPDPPTLAGVERVHLLTILGIVFQSDLSFREHVKQVVTRCAQNIYAIRILRAHGLQGENLWSVTNSTLVSRATYASQAWWGMMSMGCRERLQATFKKVIKQDFYQQTIDPSPRSATQRIGCCLLVSWVIPATPCITCYHQRGKRNMTLGSVPTTERSRSLKTLLWRKLLSLRCCI